LVFVAKMEIETGLKGAAVIRQQKNEWKVGTNT
jgi:hypothetical protein